MEVKSAIANDVALTTKLNNDLITVQSAIKPTIEVSYGLARVVELKTELVLEEFIA